MIKKKIVLFNLWVDNNVGYFDAIVKLINDLGKEIEVHETHFIPLNKFREEKLKELGI